MRILSAAALAATLSLGLASGAMAQSSGTMNGVQHGATMNKARCSPGDPNVLVNQKNKTYMMDTGMSASGSAGAMSGPSAKATPNAMTNASASSGSGAMGANAGSTTGTMSGMKSGMVSMCQSEAKSMGAKMMSSGKKM